MNKNTHRHGRRCTYLLYDPIIELQGSWAQLELAILMMGLAFQFKARWSAAKLQVVYLLQTDASILNTDLIQIFLERPYFLF